MNTLVSLVTFVALGLLLAAPGEVLNQILARGDYKAFGSTMISYTILLAIGFWTYAGILRVLRTRYRTTLVYYLLFASLGLMVEWFLLRNAPNLRDPFQPITQLGMFTFWGTMLLGPRILMESTEFAPIKRSFIRFYLSFTSLYLLIASLVPKNRGGIYFGFIIFALGYAALNWHHTRYFRQLRALRQ